MTAARHERGGLGIFASHGVADAGTTALAATVVGRGAEANPLLQPLLAEGIGFAAGVMLLVVGLIAVSYPRLATWADFPAWFAPLLTLVGALVAIGNVAVVMVA